jgi:hypothetical protein
VLLGQKKTKYYYSHRKYYYENKQSQLTAVVNMIVSRCTKHITHMITFINADVTNAENLAAIRERLLLARSENDHY